MERKLSILSNNDGLIDLYIEEFIEFDSSIIDDNSFQCLEKSYKSVITKDEIDELVYEELEEKIDDIVSDVLCDYIPPIKGHYCLADLKVYEEVEKTIRDKYDVVFINAFIESTKIYEKRLSDYIVPVLLEREECEAEYCDKGSAISRGLWEFVDNAEWQLSTISDDYRLFSNSNPVLWFGIRGKSPKEGWILDYQSTNWSDFWYPEDERDEWSSVVEDCHENLLVWMICECGVELPDRQEVLKKCPIDINENDDTESIEIKIRSYVQQIPRY